MNATNYRHSFVLAILFIATGFSGAGNAEGFSMDPATKVQTTQAVESAANAVADVKSMAVQSSLTDTLAKQLGISSEQAKGGAGALFQLAKDKLDAGQFADLSKAVPEMDSLLRAAPKQSVALSGLGGSSNPYGNLAGLASTFKELNLSPDMVDQFVPVVVDYVRTSGGALTANMLQSVLYGGL